MHQHLRGQKVPAPHRKKHPHALKAHAHTLPVEPLVGTIHINARGFGYVRCEGREEDLEVTPERLATALHQDTVKVLPLPSARAFRPQAEVLEIVSRATTRFTGTLEEENGFLFVRPDDFRVYTDFILDRSEEEKMRSECNKKVLIELVRWSNPKKNPIVRVLDVLGQKGEHETELFSIVAGKGFDRRFPPAVVREAEDIERGKEAFFEKEIARRRDFRSVPTFTVDPADAKDFDDAISVRILENGHIEVGVHIADVSAYLTEGSAMDTEAEKRATSIYLVDRTIPMLPEALSEDLCSLVPEQDRLAMSAVFELSTEGDVYARWFGESVIRSDKRFTYQEAQEVLNNGRGILFKELLTADTIARNLREARFRNGSIGFETDEIKFELDEKGRPVRAFRKERIDTMLMIEDLMLLANREVATWMHEQTARRRGTFVWRIHDTPKPDRIAELSLFLKALGYDLPHKNGIVGAKAITALFEKTAGSPEQDMVETATIRSMAKAIYSVKNIGHFGLAFDFYTHFTSPIRRYPDVLVHRLVKQALAGKYAVGDASFLHFERLCAHCTEREIAAAEAERDSIRLKQMEFLAPRVGDTFEGVVSGVTEYGFYVEEHETMAEGMVRVNSLRDDFYELRDHGFRLVGAKGKRSFSLGDPVRVRLLTVDLERKQITWEVV